MTDEKTPTSLACPRCSSKMKWEKSGDRFVALCPKCPQVRAPQGDSLLGKLLGAQMTDKHLIVIDDKAKSVIERFVTEWTTQEGCGAATLDDLCNVLSLMLKT